MNPVTDQEHIATLEAQCRSLASKLKNVETETAQKVREAAIDCAAIFSEQSVWHLTLYRAIGKFVDQGECGSDDLRFPDRDTVSGLAAIGLYLADRGFGTAETFRKNAEAVTL